jgi:hypothetical protein
MYASAFGRAPTEVETKKCLAFLESQGKLHGDPAAPAAWNDLAHVLYNSKEFIFVH